MLASEAIQSIDDETSPPFTNKKTKKSDTS